MKKPSAREVAALVKAALTARKRAYCPYSRYLVGASVLTESGRIFSGCNVENASYGLSLCAERVAIFTAAAAGHTALRAVCVAAHSAKPCGACRQVMIEFSTKNTALYLVDLNPRSSRQKIQRTTVHKMLPAAFDPLTSGLLPSQPHDLIKLKIQARPRRKRLGRRRGRAASRSGRARRGGRRSARQRR